jgi:hypothetical protein
LTVSAGVTTVKEVPRVWLTALLVGTVGCSGSPNIPIEGCPRCKAGDAGRPTGKPDAGTDGGAFDAGVDAGIDGGPFDAGGDAGSSDAGFDAGLPLTGNVCPTGSLIVGGETTDACAGQSLHAYVPLAGVQVATLQPYSATLSDSNGKYSICVPPIGPFTLVFTMPTYVTAYEAEFVSSSLLPAAFLFEVQMLCESALHTYVLQEPLFNANEASVASELLSVSGTSPCYTADAGYSGWSFQATLPDGGAGPGGPWPTDYIDASGDLQSVATSAGDGEALMYNIDPSVGYVSVTASNSALQSACPPLDADVGFTGRLYVAPSSLSFYPWLVP